MVQYSLIVLSNTNSKQIFEMNSTCFQTFIESVEYVGSTYEIILIESNKIANYNYSVSQLKTIIPDENFGFHRFLNIGIANANGTYIILSNNDVVYEKKWLKEITEVTKKNNKIKSFSPYDATSNKLSKKIISKYDYVIGYDIQKHVTGWCLVLHKSILKKIKRLDEQFNFYYADFDYAMQLIKHNIKHALVTKAKVKHLEGASNNKGKKVDYNKLPKHTPHYLIRENHTWILSDEKMLDGLIKFHNKWGTRRAIKIKLYLVSFFNKIGLNFCSKIILFHKN